jgi:hypothetical protein
MKRYIILACIALLLVPVLALPQWPGPGWSPSVPTMSSAVLKDVQHWWRAVPGLVGGNTLYDLVPGSLDHGTFTNMGYSSTSGWSGTARPGGLAQLNFDGVDDYVQTPQPSGMAVNRPVTLCVWVYSTAVGIGGGGRVLLRMSNPNTFTGIMFHWADSNTGTDVQRPSFSVDSDSGLFVVIRVTADRPLNTWEHLCATYDGSQTPGGMFLYANGVNLATVVETNTGFGAFTNNPWRIGAHNNATPTDFFQGAMDDIMVYTRALSPGELAWLYQLSRTDPAALFAPMPGVVAGPVARGAGQFFPFFR